MSSRSSLRLPFRRRGSLAVEAMLVIPIIAVITIAIMEFGVLLSVQQAIVHAVIDGAREAGKGATIDDVEIVVEESLAAYNIEIGPNASVVVEDPETMSVEQRGTLACDPPASPMVDNGKIRVTVCVSTTGTPVAGTLNLFGYANLASKVLTKSAVVKKEFP